MKIAATRSAALAVLLPLVLTACGGEDTVITEEQRFNTSLEGVQAEAGSMWVRNVVLVAGEEGDAVSVIAAFANRSEEPDALVEVRVGEASARPAGGSLDIPARGYAFLTPDEGLLQVPGVDVQVGRSVEVTMVFERAPQATVRALVEAADGRYIDAAPTPESDADAPQETPGQDVAATPPSEQSPGVATPDGDD